jgi:fermentation-respiration switch protein FrsA (DUF1100 family)
MRPIYLLVSIFCLSLTACESYLFFPDNKFHYDPAQFGVVPEEHWFQNEKGVRLHSWYFRSKSAEPTKAVFAFFHGNAQNLTAHYRMLVWLLDFPYDFYIFDYQGYGRSEGFASIENTVSDGHAFLKKAHEFAGGLPLVVLGQSLGGAVAMRTLIDLRDEIQPALMIADSTFHSYQEVVKAVLVSRGLGWMIGALGPMIAADTYAPGDAIADLVPTPMLVVHGTADKAVPFTLGEKIYSIAQNPKDFWIVPNGNHIDAFAKHNGLYRNKLIDLLASMGI